MNNSDTFLKEQFQKLDNAKPEDKMEDIFSSMAKEILENYILIINSEEFRIKEIEFYLMHKSAKHEDVYTHEHYEHSGYKKIGDHFDINEHFINGVWRFHNSGLDIALGGKDYYGGILIRVVESKNRVETRGPIKTFDAIFNRGLGVEESFQFRLRKSEQQLTDKNEHLYKMRRVIKEVHKEDTDQRWKNKDYLFKVAVNDPNGKRVG